MSGVVLTGTRVEQLRKLRARLDLEIRAEEARELGGKLTPDPRPGHSRREVYTRPSRRRTPPDESLARTDALLAYLDVSSLEVKQWAVERGLLDHVPRGRVSYRLAVTYYQEHTQ